MGGTRQKPFAERRLAGGALSQNPPRRLPSEAAGHLPAGARHGEVTCSAEVSAGGHAPHCRTLSTATAGHREATRVLGGHTGDLPSTPGPGRQLPRPAESPQCRRHWASASRPRSRTSRPAATSAGHARKGELAASSSELAAGTAPLPPLGSQTWPLVATPRRAPFATRPAGAWALQSTARGILLKQESPPARPLSKPRPSSRAPWPPVPLCSASACGNGVPRGALPDG